MHARPLSLTSALIVLLLAPFAGCGTEEPSPSFDSSCSPTTASIEQDVFATSCLGGGCHTATDLAGDLDLETEGAAAAMVGATASTCQQTLVVAGDPEASFLYEKIASPTPGCGAPMPLDAPLDDEAIACVRGWIADLEGGCEGCGGEGCVDLSTDPQHCGACDSSCPDGSTCEGGACVCGSGLELCAGSCVDTMASGAHCGACDMACPSDLVCSLGACKDGCDGSLTVCDGGCVDTQADALHCGDCETVCDAEEVCLNGACACPGGADTQTDPNNCGECGKTCSPGQSCVMGQCTCASSSVSFSADIQPVFDASCLGNACHGGVMPAGSLDLRSGVAYGELVGVPSDQCANRPLVDPGDPTNSYLLDKVLGTNLCFGSKMPKMGSVPTSQVEAISSWICGGALDN